MSNWINRNKESLIRIAFLIPILSVAAISISHVVSWYDLANPISWAVYLSIAVEIAAMSAIAASSVKVKGFSVWFVFIIVTLIQFIGNIYFSYTEINVDSKQFKDWAELTLPLFDSFSDTADVVAQRRLLALLEGGLLPLISLTCLHFFIKYGDRDEAQPILEPVKEEVLEDEKLFPEPTPEVKETARVWERVRQLKEEGKLPEPSEEDILNEPTALANSQYREEAESEPVIKSGVSFINPNQTQANEEASDKPAVIERRNVGAGASIRKLVNK